MALMRFDPFHDLDRLGMELFSGPRTPRSIPMEAFRRGDEFIVALEVSGVGPDDVEVDVERNSVTVHAHHRPLRREGDEILIDERVEGDSRRQLLLGENLDSGKMSARLDRGVLVLTIPVAEESKPRRVEISAADGGEREISAGGGRRDSTRSEAPNGDRQAATAGRS
jgi:HSP20 family protein